MCEHGTTVPLLVVVPADLAFEGIDTLKTKPIDQCIAPLVAALNAGGVATTSSCCGHGKGPGSVLLRDGRTLTISEDG